jgi:hypothetical protein
MTRTLLVALFSFVAAQDAVKLESKCTSGDRATVTMESRIDLEIASKDGEGEKNRRMAVERSEKFEAEVQEAANGRAKLVRVKCVKAGLQKSGTNLNPTDLTSPIEGQSFNVTFGDAMTVKTLTGDPSPAEADMVGSWEDLAKLLPKKDVKLGESWTVEAKDAGAALWVGNVTEVAGSITCTLGVYQEGKATITYKASVTGTTKDGYATKLDAWGEYAFDGTKGKSVSFSMTGDLEMKKKVTERYRKPDSFEDEIREIGWITIKSKKLEAKVTFQ